MDLTLPEASQGEVLEGNGGGRGAMHTCLEKLFHLRPNVDDRWVLVWLKNVAYDSDQYQTIHKC